MDPQIKELLLDCSQLFSEVLNRMTEIAVQGDCSRSLFDEIKETQNHLRIFSAKIGSL